LIGVNLALLRGFTAFFPDNRHSETTGNREMTKSGDSAEMPFELGAGLLRLRRF
jgi:hypothetical protein